MGDSFQGLSDAERRQVDRKPLGIRVWMALPGKPEMETRSIDISVSGMGLVCDLNLTPGTPCQLAFSLPLPNGHAFKAQVAGTITHSAYSGKRNGFVIGLQFKGCGAELLAALQKYTQG